MHLNNVMKKLSTKFAFVPFSKKQKQVLTWWMKDTPHCDKDAIIADGSVRSGKTVIMSLSYVIWAMEEFNYTKFGMAGKTIGSFRRNVLFTLKIILQLRGYRVDDNRSENRIIVRKGGKENYFHIFGGKDERSQDLVQGFTAGGFFFDEVTLQPQSFVNQAIARCSVEGAKLWFNCNPDGPFHWFKIEWIDELEQKNAFRIHFLLKDNPSLSETVMARYERMFSGVFYDRYILGLWVIAEGIIYSMFNHKTMVIKKIPVGVKILKKWIGVDYGQSNATVFLLLGIGSDNRLYFLDEYYHEGRSSAIQKSPAQYSREMKKWLLKCGVDGVPVRYESVFVDPSALGFILQLYEEGVSDIRKADNDVLRGIEMLSSLIENDMVRIMSHMTKTLMEFNAYSWDPKAQERGEDKPIKQHDHAMDSARYVVNGTRQIWQKLLADAVKRVA